jgi:GT2 family glycosyltransferase
MGPCASVLTIAQIERPYVQDSIFPVAIPVARNFLLGQTGLNTNPIAIETYDSLQVSVVIPTYHRPNMLLNCVASLLAGSRRPDEIVIVGRIGDDETAETIAKIDQQRHADVKIRTAWVSVPGHVPPVETGIRTALGDLVAVVDDDVTVTLEWLSSMASHFSDPAIGVVGGRVLVPSVPPPKAKGKPGCVSWYGKIWGNLGSVTGPDSIEVDSVMEGNCVWRRDLLASLEFDPVLNFDDAAMYGLDLSLQAKKRGCKVIYDPRALVYHHIAPRAPELDRQERGRRLFCYCRNYTYIILKRFSLWRRLVFLGWWFLVGERDAWGLGSLAFDNLSGDWHKKRYLMDVLRGKTEGIRLWLR